MSSEYKIWIIGSEDYLCALDNRDLPSAYQYAEPPDPIASVEFLKCTMKDNNVHSMPNDVESTLDLYVLLTTTFETYVWS